MMYDEDYAEQFFASIRARLLYRNKNWLAICCGETGSGKSYSAMTMANMVSPRGITVARNVVFNSVELMKRITNKSGLQRGDVLIFDEAGVGLSAREWYSTQNKLLGSVLQTFRNLNIGVIFTTPNLSFVDVQARKLFHNYFETAYLDYDNEYAYLKCYNIQVNSMYDKTYYKHPRINGVKISHIGIPKPPVDLITEYELLKNEYTEKLNRDALSEMTGGKKKHTRPSSTFNADEKIIKKVKKDYEIYVRTKGDRKFLDKALIINDFKVSQYRATRIKKAVEANLWSK